MEPIKVNDKLSVAGQPDLEDFAGFAAAGFSAVLNNRPDGEEYGQPTSEAEARAAEEAGLSYAHIPVTGPTLTEEAVRAFQSALAAAPGPVLAHCRSGTRSLTLFAIGEVLDGRMGSDELRAFGAERGINLASAEAWLRAHGAGA
jgi:uncharacterized protein (TIGR01244 family)